MKNEKGAILVYTVLAMLLIFAICALITTSALTQINYTDSYVSETEHARACSQIGELFCDNNGEVLHNGNIDCEKSPFAISLTQANFTVSQHEDGWKVKSNEHEYILKFFTEQNTKTLVIARENHKDFTVSILVTDQTYILTFGKGA